MFGFFFGTLCLFGLVGVACSGNRHVTAGYGRRYGRSCGQREGQEDGGRRRRRGRASKAHFARAAGEMFKRRLDIDEDQEDIVDHALKDLFGAVKELKTAVADTKSDIAEAFGHEEVDDARLAVAFETHDEELGKARRKVVSALKQIHALLTPEQREVAVEWLNADMRWSS